MPLPPTTALAYGVVVSAGATKSVVTQVAWPCFEASPMNGSCPAARAAIFKKGRFARWSNRASTFGHAVGARPHRSG